MRKKNKIHVKSGDTVQIISGKHKGQIGQIIQVKPKTNQVIIKNLNIKIKHIRPSQEEESGQIINFEAPIHSSNVMLYSENNKIRSRYSITYDHNHQKCRILKKTKEIIA